MHHAGTSVWAAGSSASTATTRPTGTSLIRSASMIIGIGHFRPIASIVSVGVGAAVGAPGPDALVPDALVPDALVPDALVPDAPVPDAPVPDAPVPDAPVPDAPVPD